MQRLLTGRLADPDFSEATGAVPTPVLDGLPPDVLEAFATRGEHAAIQLCSRPVEALYHSLSVSLFAGGEAKQARRFSPSAAPALVPAPRSHAPA